MCTEFWWGNLKRPGGKIILKIIRDMRAWTELLWS